MASPRAAARTAVKTWLEAGNIQYLDAIFTAPPLRLDFNKYGTAPHNCQIVVFIDEEGELRLALGGEHSGKKRIDYTVSLEIYFRSTEPDTEAALAAFDELVDAIKARLRADRRLGQAESVVWQAGEGGFGIQCDFMDGNNVGGEPIEHYARVRFEITQWITS